jgi:hypothetical protein
MESVGEQVGGVKVEWADQTTHFDARHSYSETVNWGPCGHDGYDEAQECPAEYPHECSDASCRAANKSISVEKFAPSFNMGVRYWDKNMPFVALREVYYSKLSITYFLVSSGTRPVRPRGVADNLYKS